MRVRIPGAVLPGLFLLAIAGMLAAPAPAPAGDSNATGYGIAMHGDLKYPKDFAHFDYADPNAAQGGRAIQSVVGTFDSFNPFIIKGNPAAGVNLLYDTLTVDSADEPFSQYGLLAETIETPPDRSWVRFTLREEARWHDGKPITADDVIWSFNAFLNRGAPFFRFYYASVQEAVKEGERTVKFTFKPGENRELPLILGQLVVLPSHYWKERDFEATSLDPPLGSGPYKVGAFEAGRYVSYERVDDYWGNGIPVNVGRHNFAERRFDYYRDATVAIEAFKGGEYDFRLENNSKVWATGYDLPEVAKGQIVKESIPNSRPAGMQAFAFNIRRPIFRDVRVRRALAYAFDFEWSNKTLFYDQYTRTRSYFDNSELAATGLPSPAELAVLEPHRGKVPEQVFSEAYQPPATDGSGNLRANLKLAVGLLKEAGYELKDGVMTGPGGEKLAFEVLLAQPAFERIVLPFKKNLEKIGVEISVRTVDTSQYRRRSDSFDFDVVVGSFGQSQSPGNEQRDYWGSDAAKSPGSRNVIGIGDPAIDALVESLISAMDRETLVTRTRALDRVLQWNHFVIPQWHIASDRIIYWNRFGRPATTPSRGVQFDTWWVDPKKVDALAKQKRKRS
jgi:microcin C transport system substrate-binding protein